MTLPRRHFSHFQRKSGLIYYLSLSNHSLGVRFVSYTAPSNCPVEPGYRVVASFGKRKLLGYVVGTASALPAGVKEIK